MRHWHPTIHETVTQIVRAGLNQVTAICMTPFTSHMSSGAYHEQLQRAIDEVARSADHQSFSGWRDSLTLTKVTAWYNHPTFVRTLAEKVEQGLAALPGDQRSTAVVLFSAHSLPSAVVEQGDPYHEQFQQLASLVAAESGLNKGQWYTCYQSQGAASGRWLGPSLEETIQQAAAAGVDVALVAPIGFLADNVEILFDIEIEAHQYAEELGLHLARTSSLNADPTFIEALYEILQQEQYRER
jgi:ferrochelatase